METTERPPLMHWTVERFMALVESGVIPERRGIELVDGQVVIEMPQEIYTLSRSESFNVRSPRWELTTME